VTRVRLALLLLAVAASAWLAVVPPAHREREAAEQESVRLRDEARRLRLRLANEGRHRREEPEARAADGAAAVKALRAAALRATSGTGIDGVEIAANPEASGIVAARCRLGVRGRFVNVLRVGRRLADPTSGLLLKSVALSSSGDDVRLEAEGFILREAQ